MTRPSQYTVPDLTASTEQDAYVMARLRIPEGYRWVRNVRALRVGPPALYRWVVDLLIERRP